MFTLTATAANSEIETSSVRESEYDIAFVRPLSNNDAWLKRAKCRDLPPETFFPSDGVGVETAKAICATCPVAKECLNYALESHINHGVWGGVSERGRRRMARQLEHAESR